MSPTDQRPEAFSDVHPGGVPPIGHSFPVAAARRGPRRVYLWAEETVHRFERLDPDDSRVGVLVCGRRYARGGGPVPAWAWAKPRCTAGCWS